MRTSFILAATAIVATPMLFLACVGEDASTPPTQQGPDGSSGGTPPQAPPGANPPPGQGDDGGGSSSGDADAGPPKCGYAGEACCTGGLAPCNPGTVCTSNVCVANDVVAVGDQFNIGTFHHNGASAIYNGLGWSPGPNLGVDADDLIPYGVWAQQPGQYWAVTNSTSQAAGNKLMLYSGGATPQWLICGNFGCNDPQATTSTNMWGVISFGLGDLWVGGTNLMKHCTGGSTCTSVTSGLPASWGQGTFTGTSSSDLWYPQFDKAFHYNGTTWTVHASVTARAMWAHSATDVWGGDTAGLQHWDGAAWSPLYAVGGAAPPGTIYGMSGSASDDVWAVGYKNDSSGTNTPFTAHWDGKTWSLVPIDASAKQLQVIWVASKKEAFAASYDGGIWKWNGTAWSAMTATAGVHWTAIHGSAKPRP